MNIWLANGKDLSVLPDVWLRSVQATHTFLSEEDIYSMIPQVKDYLTQESSEFWIVCDDETIMGFMGMSGRKMESLFLTPEFHRRGAGKRLVGHALSRYGDLLVDVNEQNSSARLFYEACGFAVVGRSDIDEQGRAYPLIHMRMSPPKPPPT